jgi:uncharacterized protein (TIGR02246 family)
VVYGMAVSHAARRYGGVRPSRPNLIRLWVARHCGLVTLGHTARMKTLLGSTWALSLALCVIPVAHGQTDAHAPLPSATQCSVPCDDRAIRDIPERWKAAYNAGQAAQVSALYTEDAYYLTQHFVSGIIHGRADIQAYVQRGVDARYHIDSIEVLLTQCSGDFAYAVTRYQSNNAGRIDIGVNLVILRKTNGQWMIAAHEAAVPDPATAIRQLRDR